jgi:hypothetical protein
VSLEELVLYGYRSLTDLEFEQRLARSSIGRMIAAGRGGGQSPGSSTYPLDGGALASEALGSPVEHLWERPEIWIKSELRGRLIPHSWAWNGVRKG